MHLSDGFWKFTKYIEIYQRWIRWGLKKEEKIFYL